jgi:hypothetical protein
MITSLHSEAHIDPATGQAIAEGARVGPDQRRCTARLVGGALGRDFDPGAVGLEPDCVGECHNRHMLVVYEDGRHRDACYRPEHVNLEVARSRSLGPVGGAGSL